MIKVGVVSLGCDKNTVDTEKMLYLVKTGGYDIVADPALADVIIVNTCAFIEPARKEAVDTIFEYAAYKKKLIVTGCLPQKYIDEIFDEFVEVDAFLGTNDYTKICEAIEEVLRGKRLNFVGAAAKDNGAANPTAKKISDRIQSTPRHYAYLKIADGCKNCCTFCTIPSIRGAYRSCDMDTLVAEAAALAENGVKELILVAQDVTAYGIDLYGEYKIVELLQRLTKIEKLVWVRLLYCYPDKISDALIEEIAANKKICKYLDIPLQHISDGILKKMGRKYVKADIKALLEKLRARIPEISLRSTFIVGFPTETEEDFKELCGFIKSGQIDHAGFFEYSPEDGTPAAKMEQLDADTKRVRLDTIRKINQNICFERQSKKRDKTVLCMVDYYDKDTYAYVCRDEGNAPQVDTVIYVDDFKTTLAAGDLTKVRITCPEYFDLWAVQIKED